MFLSIAIEEKELEDFIESMKETIDNDTLLKRDAVFAKFSFRLENANLGLYTNRKYHLFTF